MKSAITKWITDISVRQYSPYEKPPDYRNESTVNAWTIRGDGVGDFEEMANVAPPATVQKYIDYLKDQLKLAEMLLADMEKEEEHRVSSIW